MVKPNQIKLHVNFYLHILLVNTFQILCKKKKYFCVPNHWETQFESIKNKKMEGYEEKKKRNIV